jgi:leucyl/phenylalanyl-tRNA---protein transferase
MSFPPLQPSPSLVPEPSLNGAHPGSSPGQAFAATCADRRAELFRETPAETLQRWALGLAWALKPERIAGLPALGRLWAADLLSPKHDVPWPDAALARPAGLCGIAHDVTVASLVEAHRRGLYPFAHIAPLKWWCPPQRCVLSFADFHISKTVRRLLRQNRYRVTFDTDFVGVIKACAGRRRGKWQLTWITPQIMHAYADLHDAGYAHSFEVWNSEDELVGGGYGVAVGGAFTIESQFTRESHTSKIGFAALNWHLANWGFRLNDNKGPTRNTLEMGFRVVPRPVFLALLTDAMRVPDRVGRWQVETDLRTVADWQPQNEVRTPADGAAKTGASATHYAPALLVPALEALDQGTLSIVAAVCAAM